MHAADRSGAYQRPGPFITDHAKFRSGGELVRERYAPPPPWTHHPFRHLFTSRVKRALLRCVSISWRPRHSDLSLFLEGTRLVHSANFPLSSDLSVPSEAFVFDRSALRCRSVIVSIANSRYRGLGSNAKTLRTDSTMIRAEFLATPCLEFR